MARRREKVLRISHSLEACRKCESKSTAYVSNNSCDYCDVKRELCVHSYTRCSKCEIG